MAEPYTQWLDRIRCPRCASEIVREADSLSCPSCAAEYPIVDGIPRLIIPENVVSNNTFCDRYDALRMKEGWASEITGYYEALPFQDLTDRHTDEWRLRVTSFRLIEQWLHETFGTERGILLDVGAGTGWLSRLLTDRHEVAALDLNAGPHGLAAVPVDRRLYTAIQADLDRIPLMDECCHVVIANASLHYARTPDRYLRESHRILKPDGTLIIIDSPVYPTQNGADQAYERTRLYYNEMGFPELAEHYGGLVASCFATDELFHFQCLRRDFSRVDLLKKRIREALGSPESARFSVWIGKKE